MGYSNLSGTLPIVTNARVVFYREKAANMYCVEAFALANVRLSGAYSAGFIHSQLLMSCCPRPQSCIPPHLLSNPPAGSGGDPLRHPSSCPLLPRDLLPDPI